jgi:hypothetical protein
MFLCFFLNNNKIKKIFENIIIITVKKHEHYPSQESKQDLDVDLNVVEKGSTRLVHVGGDLQST